jgi:AcrR family transcriptional regulator
MGRPRQRSDEDILRVARECFVTEGASVATSTIAEKLGISQAVLFQRFATKQALIRAALEPQGTPEWVKLAARPLDRRPTREQLHELADAVHAFFVEMLPRFEVLQSCGMGPRCAEGEPHPVRFLRALTSWFARGTSAGRLRRHDPEAIAMAFIGALQVRAWFQHIKQVPDEEGPRYVESVVDLIWNAVAPTTRRTAPPRARRRKPKARKERSVHG